jgi:methionyl-tRNA formyltransferase
VQRIVIFCTDENVFHPPMFARLLELQPDIVSAFFFTPPKAHRFVQNLYRCFKYDGWRAAPRLARHWLRRHWRLEAKSSKWVFRHHDVAIQGFNNPNAPDCISALRALDPTMVLNNQPWILRPEVLSLPIPFLNKHTAALPKYRGVEPIFHALLAREPRIGVVVHTVTRDTDAGDVLAERYVAASDSVFDCYARTFAVGAELYAEAIKSAAEGRKLRTVDATRLPYYTWPDASAIESFRAAGLRYL